jgi:hypothetical protein
VNGIARVELLEPSGGSLVVWPVPTGDARGGITVFTSDFLLELSWATDEEQTEALRSADSIERAP